MGDALVDEAATLLDDAVDLRRRLHRHPELRLENPRTQTAILDALDGLGLTIHTGTATTSVVAILDGDEPGPTVLLRGDMDGLPMPEDTGLDYASEVDGAMHACGHDTHVAMLVGAARLLTARKARLTGRVAFMFQPGEEGGGGAKVMLDEGLLATAGAGADPVSFAFAIHQSPTAPSGVIASKGSALLASADGLLVTVRGRGGHASMPHHACDPIPIACEIVTAIQTAVTRRIDVFDPAVVTIAMISAGSAGNVIPETATMVGTIRTVSESTRRRIHDDLRRLCAGIAAAHGAEADVEVVEGYPVTVNDDDAAAFVLAAAGRTLGPAAVAPMPTPVMGAEDWSYVLQEVTGAMAFLGTRPPGVHPHDVAPNHSNRMVLDEGAMVAGMATHVAVATGWLDPARWRAQV